MAIPKSINDREHQKFVDVSGEPAVRVTGALTIDPTGLATDTKQDAQTVLLQGIAGFTVTGYDYVSLSYTGSNLTGVIFKTGGSGGTAVATLTLGYDGSNNLTSVTKS